jgi:hypothetical protein
LGHAARSNLIFGAPRVGGGVQKPIGERDATHATLLHQVVKGIVDSAPCFMADRQDCVPVTGAEIGADYD